MRKHYPEDVTGVSPDNVAEGSLSTATYPNRFNLVVPFEGPFFRNGLEVKDTAGNLLFEGIDYYLALYYSAGAHAVNAQIFGGIMLLAQTEITYKIQVLGSSYAVPESDIGLFLVNPDLSEPRNLDWSTLMRYPVTVNAIDPPADVDEAVARDEIVAAINNIRLKIEEKAGQMDVEIDKTITALSRAASKIYQDNLLQHHKTPHQHHYTPAQIGALAVDGVATDTVKVFSKTLAELVAILVEHKISQRVVDTLIDDTMGQVFGRFKAINNDELVYATADGKAALRFSDGKILLTGTEAVVEIAADSDNNQRGIGVGSRAGYDELFVPSNGDGVGVKAVRPIYNGAFLITPSSIDIYLYPPLNSNAQPTFESTDTVRMGGSGSDSSPLNLTANPPAATATSEGLFRLTENVEVIAPNYALSQKGVNDLLLKLNNYVDETFTINGAAFGSTQTINLTTLSFGLDKVDNTAPADKPAHQRFRDALSAKALKTHTHVPGDLLNVPIASETVSGLAYLYTVLDTTENKAAVAKLGYQLKLDIDAAEDKAKNLLPAWVANSTYYGDEGFLPIPVAGRYSGFSQIIGAQAATILREENGRLYALRTATEGYTGSERVMYWMADINADTTLANPTPTTVEYQPVGLTILAPGVRLTAVRVVGEDAAIFLGSDTNHYLVLFEGTINMAKHTKVAKVTLGAMPSDSGVTIDTFVPGQDRVVVVGDSVLYLKTVLSNTDFFMCLWKGKVADITSGSLTLTAQPLTGKYPDGALGRFVTQGAGTTDPNTTSLWYSDDAALAKWTSPSVIAYNRRNIVVGVSGNKVRVRLHPRSRPTGQTENILGPWWNMSYTLDLDTNSVALDLDYLPLYLSVNGVEFPNGEYPKNANGGFNGAGNLSLFNFNNRLWAAGSSDTDDNVYLVKTEVTPFEAALCTKPLDPIYGRGVLSGPYGTPYKFRMRGMLHLGGSAQKVLLRERGSSACILSGYDTTTTYGIPGYGGWGPSNVRSVVSASVYEAICRLGYVWDGGQCYLNGTSFNGPGSQKYKNTAGTVNLTSDTVSVSSTQWNDFQSMLQVQLAKWGGAIAKVAWLSMFDIGGQNICIGQAVLLESEGVANYGYSYFFKIPMTFSNGTLTLNYTNATLVAEESRWALNATSLTALVETSQMRLLKRADGWVIVTRTLCRVNTTGTAQELSYTLRCDSSWANWKAVRANFYIGSGEKDTVHLPESNEIVAVGFVETGIYLGGTAYSNNAYNYDQGSSRPVILFGPQVAEGMILYITQDIRFFAEAESMLIPAHSFDLKALFPSSYQDATFYFYAVADGQGGCGYTVLQEKLADTDRRLYIGYATTSETTISDAKIDRVKRLGRVGALLVHADNPYAHDYLEGGTLSKSIYSVMENMGTIDAFSFPSFKDIYDSWYRFSHTNDTQDQPANQSELTAWKYVEADDVVECTLNTATYVGFISDELVGDYTFNSLITSADGDNDAVAVVLAALKKEDNPTGREQTLSLAIGCSIEGHLDLQGRIQLKENYRQSTSRTVATLEADAASIGAWQGWYAHVYAQRRGNMLYIAVEQAQLPTTGDRDSNIRAILATKKTLTLSQLRNTGSYRYVEVDLSTAAPTFARSCRFGYGATSQNATRFWNLQRPGADLSKTYGSAAALEVANGLAGNYNPALTKLKLSASSANWLTAGNKAYKLWPKVTASPSARATPVAQTICPVGVNNMAAGQAWVTRVDFVSTAASLTMSIDVDDTVDVYLNGIKQGTVSAGTAAPLTLNNASVNGTNVLAMVVAEAPGNTPCYLAFTVKDSTGTLLASSSLDMSWSYLASATDLNSVLGIKYAGETSITIPNGDDYTLALRREANPSVAVPYRVVESMSGANRIVLLTYDCTDAVNVDVMIHDSTLSA